MLPMAVGDDDKVQVQQATDIVSLVGEQVALKPQGREYLGLCPFHDDNKPSMYVVPAKQIYHCFSCGAGGDVFTFTMNFHKMAFVEALRHLAQRAGIELSRDKSGAKAAARGPSERERIAEANRNALEFFRATLKHTEHGKQARDYIDQRGISNEMVGQFQIGAAPDRWDGLVQMAQSKGWDFAGLEKAGLINQRKSGNGYYDRLRHRLIFPILDALGRPIAFGGRILPGSTRDDQADAKYLNSPETKLFDKSSVLYGLHRAKPAILRGEGMRYSSGGADPKSAVIVEGYTDVIAAHQVGLSNVVATLGTALTERHVTELRRYCERVVLIFDPDEAGQRAADRAVELFLTGDLDVGVTTLAENVGSAENAGRAGNSRNAEAKDPADLLAEEDGVAKWEAALGRAQDALTYQLERVREQLQQAGTITGRQKVAEAYLAKLAELGLEQTGKLRRSLIIQQVAELLGMGELTVKGLLDQHRPRSKPASRPVTAPDTSAPQRGADAQRQEGQNHEDSPAASGNGGIGAGTGLVRSAHWPPASSEDSFAEYQAALAEGEVEPDVEAADEAVRQAAAMQAGEVESPAEIKAQTTEPEYTEPEPPPWNLSPSRMKAVEQAERQIIGCLLRDNELFHRTLPGGSTLDEALMPVEMVSPEGRRLYERLYDALAEGHKLDLAGMLGELASENQSRLSTRLTQADFEIQQAAGDDEELRAQVLDQAVGYLLALHEQRAYKKIRSQLVEKLAGPPNNDSIQAAALTEARQRLAGRSAPGRILRRRG